MTTSDTPRAADMVVATLEKRIQTGALPDGSALPPERALMQEFGTSRTVVREAVQKLSNRGLVEARPRFRPRVRAPGYNTAIDAVGSIVTHLLAKEGGVRNLFDTRTMVEAALVREAAKSATKEHLAGLRAALQANLEAINTSAEFYQTDVAFHELLYQIPANPVLPAIHQAYTAWLSPQWAQMPRLPDRNRRNYEDHKAIFEAILMRDPDAAESALRAHLGHAWQQVHETFGHL